MTIKALEQRLTAVEAEQSVSRANPDDLAAIQEAIDDMEAGDKGIPFEDFDREFRARRNLPPRS